MSPTPLFRPEAVAAQAGHRLGAIRLAQPIGATVAARAACGVIALIVGFATFGSYTERATVPGSLEPVGGALRLTAPVAVLVSRGQVVEGQGVERQHAGAGDVLFVLSAERRSSSGSTQVLIESRTTARRATLERDRRPSAERHRSRSRAASERLAAIDVESEQLARASDIDASREVIAQKNVERFDERARTGFVAAAQARLDDALVMRGQRENDERIAANLLRERIGLVGDEGRRQARASPIVIIRTTFARPDDDPHAGHTAHRSRWEADASRSRRHPPSFRRS